MKNQKILLSAVLLGGVLFSGSAMADHPGFALEPDITVIYMKSDIYKGGLTNPASPMIPCPEGTDPSICVYGSSAMDGLAFDWSYKGNVYAAVVNPATGEQSGPIQQIGTVEGHPLFPASFGMLASGGPVPPTLPWTCQNCTLVISGSTFNRIDTMALDGRAFSGLGPVSIPNPAQSNLLGIRMAGCAGVQEVSGTGKYANMRGTLCLNGTIGFDPITFSGVGASNCVMVLQH